MKKQQAVNDQLACPLEVWVALDTLKRPATGKLQFGNEHQIAAKRALQNWDKVPCRDCPDFKPDPHCPICKGSGREWKRST